MQPEITKLHALQNLRAFIDVHVVGDTTIIASVPGTKIRIYKVVLTAGGAAVITLKEGMRENSGGLRVANNGNVVLMFDSDMPIELPEGQPLVLNLNAAIRVTGFVEYTQVK
jgi:hypothetical protein